METKSIFCRVHYCPKCNSRGIPKLKTPFVVYGGNTNEYHLRRVSDYGVRGFSPHIILLGKVAEGKVKYYFSCCICNTQKVVKESGEAFYVIPDDSFQIGFISLRDWNVWMEIKDLGYRI